MISSKENPVEWAALSFEIDELIQHLQDLSSQMKPGSTISEGEFDVAVGHAYSHLNRIWNSRNHKGEVTEELQEKYSEFPTDIKLYG